MAEFIIPTMHETREFLDRVAVELDQKEIVKVYGGVFPDRKVLLLSDNSILKIRSTTNEGLAEVTKLKVLEASYRIPDGRIPAVTVDLLSSGYMVIHMPWLGVSLPELAQEMSSLDYDPKSQVSFRGFTEIQVRSFIQSLLDAHMQFAHEYGLIHGDVKQQGHPPSNVVFNQSLNSLLLIDAEALAPLTAETAQRFSIQLRELEVWMQENICS